ncbi:hypothetical protein C6P45_000339 [Maudiozyma exigua]|uniref:Splicing factor YJU2 n=1 Tax=Maudiozyma exigua TaxID=34358 RepID=A0A9P6W8E3_MAUEX|nr:hypothetical protein C6P45_000339 [Kazachstania exigua]
MSERKSINKYYPPDYNPIEAEKQTRKLARKLKNGSQRDIVTIRLMTPFSMRSSSCDTFIPKNRKFNGKKELLKERYLNNVKIYRLVIRCPLCSNTISFRTDPRSSDYVMESGAIRNFIKKSDVVGEDKEETVDETLERLAKEKEDEEKEQTRLKNRDITEIDGVRRNKNSGEDKMAVLEERLTKIQREQENAEEIELLRRQNYNRMNNAGRAMDMVTKQMYEKPAEDDTVVDKMVEDAFNHRETTVKEARTTETRTKEASKNTEVGHTNETLPVKRIIIKNKNKKKPKIKLVGGINKI